MSVIYSTATKSTRMSAVVTTINVNVYEGVTDVSRIKIFQRY